MTTLAVWPSYLALLESGELELRAQAARRRMESCDLCARRCRVNRLGDARGAACRTGALAVVHGHGPHYGEERPLTGHLGSGTIFFSWCSLRCVFCQNWTISQRGDGVETSSAALARMMLDLQRLGCHNLNLVTPSHVVAQVLEALVLAARRGLRLPIVWNTGGYDSREALDLLDGIVDIYMPDIKYADDAAALAYSRAPGYWAACTEAVREMHRQVGDLVVDEDGLARRGLLVRHLVLPGGSSGTRRVLEFLAEEISPDTYLNLMDQYRPAYRAWQHPPLDRSTTTAEYDHAVLLAAEAGLHRLDAPRRR